QVGRGPGEPGHAVPGVPQPGACCPGDEPGLPGAPGPDRTLDPAGWRVQALRGAEVKILNALELRGQESVGGLTMKTGPCRVNASGQIMHEPCGWTTDVQRTGNAVRCCKCGGLFEWRDGQFFPAAPVNPALATLRAAGKAVATVGQVALGLAVLAFG